MAEHLVEQVAACIWRLRRVPDIEAGIFEYRYFCRQADHASWSMFETDFGDEKREAKARLDEPRAVLGDVFKRSQRSLISLIRIAGVNEGSMYRAIRELERIKAERQDPVNDDSVIDVEEDDEDQLEPSKPRLIES